MKYSLNLSPKYAPNWSAWEIAREFVCNAIDAAPNEYKTESPNANTLRVWTPTAPSIAEMFMIGEGSKGPGGGTIGQFGEGAKIAALACTRLKGSRIAIHTKDANITFGFEDVLGSECLHAYVEDASNPEGMTVDIQSPGIASSIAGRIFAGIEDGPMSPCNGIPKLYVKGVFIAEHDAPALWDWNLKDVTINRDRAMPDVNSFKWEIVYWLAAHGQDSHFDALIAADRECIELDHARYSWDTNFHRKLKAAAERKYGEKFCLRTTNDEANANAKKHGYKDINCSEWLAYALKQAGVKLSTDIEMSRSSLEPVDSKKYSDQIRRLRRMTDFLNVSCPTVCIFKNNTVSLMGLAQRDDNQLWLNEFLFTESNEFELVRTFLHELAHFISESGDATRNFENALDWIAATFAVNACGVLA